MPPRPRSSLARVLADLQTGLAAAGLEWYLFGARAAQLRGLRRATVDVDITVFAQSNDASVVVAALADSFSLRVPDLEAFVRTTRVLPLIHDRTSIPVDAVLGGPGLEPYFLARAESIEHEGVPVHVPIAEDLVVMKVLAGRDHRCAPRTPRSGCTGARGSLRRPGCSCRSDCAAAERGSRGPARQAESFAHSALSNP